MFQHFLYLCENNMCQYISIGFDDMKKILLDLGRSVGENLFQRIYIYIYIAFGTEIRQALNLQESINKLSRRSIFNTISTIINAKAPANWVIYGINYNTRLCNISNNTIRIAHIMRVTLLSFIKCIHPLKHIKMPQTV